MNLTNPREITRRLRRRALAEFARDAEAAAAYRRARLARRPLPLPLWLLRPVMILFRWSLLLLLLAFMPIPLFGSLIGAVALGTQFLLALIAVGATFLTVMFASTELWLLHASPWVRASSFLPLSDGDYCRWLRKPAIALFGLAMYLFLWVYVMVALEEEWGPLGWALIPAIAALQSLLIVAGGRLLVAFLPRCPYGRSITAVGILLGLGLLNVAIRQYIVEASFVALPAGWVNAVLLCAWQWGMKAAWWGLVPVALLIAAGAWATARLVSRFRIREYVIAGGSPSLAVTNLWPDPASTVERSLLALRNPPGLPVPEGNPELDARSALELIRRRDFLRPAMEVEEGLFSWWHRLFLSEREATLFDFLNGERTRWNRAGGWILQWMAYCAALQLLPLAQNSPVLWFLMAAVLAMPPMLLLVGLLGIPWFGFLPGDGGGGLIPRFGFVPIGFNETSRTMIKVASLRALFALPLLCMAAVAAPVIPGTEWTMWLIIAVAAVLFCMLSQGLVTAVRFRATSPLPNLSWRRLHWIGIWILLDWRVRSLIGLLATIALIRLTKVPTALAGGFALLAASSLGGWLAVRRMYRQGLVDFARTSESHEQKMLRAAETAHTRQCHDRERRERRHRLSQIAGEPA